MTWTQDCWTSFIVSVCRCSTRHVQIRPVLSKASGRGPGRRGVMHAVDCEEVPAGALMLPLDRALDTAEQPDIRVCSLCGATAELDPVLRGFDHGFE
ncbi:DUF6233 domain-containing protein [Streptomyces sp. NBC_01361]|uniref:DUF6233 domain-containing protein n=1 Tax=Streptomyces sp. NBC_01361 TaxID=2903838 RepID=UPI002E324588|nr:DUF6233 domain-containing protein [Streptomyces sp. NBC_01361]